MSCKINTYYNNSQSCSQTTSCGSGKALNYGNKPCSTSNSCNPNTYSCAPAVGDSQYLINQNIESQRCQQKTSCKTKKIYSNNNNCCQDEQWPPPTTTDCDPNTITLYVGRGGNYCNINEAFKSLPKDDTKKYKLYLQPGITHNLNISPDCDHNDVSLLGDVHKSVGVFYGQNCALEGLSVPYSKVQLRNGSGLGPYNIKMDKCCNPCGPFSLSVFSQSDYDPDFSEINNKYTLIFKHANGSTTKHPVLYGNCNTITLACPISTCGCLKTGEGFYLEPNTTLNFCGDGDQTLLMEERLELYGFVLTGQRQTFIGATEGSLSVGHCVSLMDHFVGYGKLDCPLPNVWLNETYFSGCNGRMISQTWLGSKSNLEFTNCSGVNILTSIVLQSDKGINLLNGSSVSFPYTMLYKNNKALYIGSGSTASIPGCLFKCNNMAVYCTSNSNLTAEYSLKAPVTTFTTYFDRNNTAIELNENATAILDVGTFSKNKLTSVVHGQSQIAVLNLTIDSLSNPYPNQYNPAFNGTGIVHIDPLGIATVYPAVPVVPGQKTTVLGTTGATSSSNIYNEN